MSKNDKPDCFADPDTFDEDHDDCMGCDYYTPCRVLSNRKKKSSKKKRKTRRSSTIRRRRSTKRSSSSSSSKRRRSASIKIPVVDAPDATFGSKLIFNTIRETVDSTIGEFHRAWNESIPRVKYSNILGKLVADSKEGDKSDAAEEVSEEESSEDSSED